MHYTYHNAIHLAILIAEIRPYQQPIAYTKAAVSHTERKLDELLWSMYRSL